MKIVYCIKSLHHAGGMERVTTTKANYFAEQGHDVTIVVTDLSRREPFFLLNPSIHVVDLSINYDEIDGTSRLRKYWHLYKHRQRHRKLLTEYLKQAQPDITISTGYHEFSFLHSIKDGSIKVGEHHGSFGNIKKEHRFSSKNYLRRLMAWWATRSFASHASRYDCMQLLTKEDASFWEGKIKHQQVIHNIVPIHSDITAPLSNKRCIVVARFSHEKNLHEILEIWAMVSAQHPDWELVFFGDGYMQQSLEDRARALKIDTSCHFYSPTNTITQEYLQSSILLMTSHSEGLPMVLLEAQEVGLPSICYAFHCGARDVICDAIEAPGFVVPYGDRHAFAEKLSLLMEDEGLRYKMGQAAKANAHRFIPEVILPQWDALFQSLTKEKK